MRKNPISKNEIEKIDDIIEDIRCGRLEKEHPLQRHGGGIWSTEQESNLIRRVLHDGKFLPILICTQYDDNGCEIKYLIDGLQRISAFARYMEDEFPISKNTIDYMVSFDGVLYETKQLKSGKFALKRDRKTNKLFPILDENGKQQKVEQTIDIRGLKFSELPPELQLKIKRYVVSVQYKLECTDEDIQIEILDYNSGTKMNDAQIGKNRLGTEFAKIVTDLTKHSFIKNKCGFTLDNRIKGVIDRAVNESLMLVNFGANEWVTSHKDLCRKLSAWLTTDHTNLLEEMFNDLDSILPEDEDVKKYLTLKNFFVIMANYKHFLDLEVDYQKNCYSIFILDFIKHLSQIKNIPTGEVDDEGNDIMDSFNSIYMTGTKQKGSIEERLNLINKMLEDYLLENCSEMIEEDEEISEEDSLNEYVSEIKSIGLPYDTNEMALKILMQFESSYPARDFSQQGLDNFRKWLYINSVNEDTFYDCIMSATILRDHLNNAGASDKFSENDIAILTHLVFSYGEDLEEDIFEAWLEDYNNVNHCDESGTSAAILEKYSFLRDSYSNFINYITNDEGEMRL